MAGLIYPEGADPTSYRGLPALYEYINADGELRQFNCGQAAACTFLTHYRSLPSEPTGEEARTIITQIEDDHPPDNLGGWFGTSRRRVERICRTHGYPVEVVEGEEALRRSLAEYQPVIVMLGTEGPPVFRGWHAPAGHWMVAYGYDDRQIFLANFTGPAMSWEEFRRWWGALVPRLISMRNVGLAAVTQLATQDGLPTEARVIV